MPNNNIAVRPINKGMIRNLPSQALPQGALIEAANFNVTTNGLEARGGFSPLYVPLIGSTTKTLNNIFNQVTGDVQNTFLFEQNDGQKQLLTLTNEAMYKMRLDREKFERIRFTGTLTTTHAIALSPTEVELRVFNDDSGQFPSCLAGTQKVELEVRDYAVKDSEIGQITSMTTDATHYIIIMNVDDSVPWINNIGLTDIELNFKVELKHKINYTLVNGIETNTVVVTANRGVALAEYNLNGAFSPVPIDSTSAVGSQYDIIIQQANVSQWFKNRLWLASTLESGKKARQRIRWSDATTYLDLTTSSRFRPENYVDLSDSMGEVLAIYPMGIQLIVYCSDAVYMGNATNLNNLPYAFTKINTPGIGLVGQSAITPWVDGHYFVGQDEIYFISPNGSIQEVGTAVLPITLDICYNKAGIDVRPDPSNSRLLFLFPEQTGDGGLDELNCATKLYSFNYKTGAWSFIEASYDDSPTGKDYKYHFSSISSSMLYSGSTSWQDYVDLSPVGEENPATYTWDDWATDFSSWDALKDGQLTDHTMLYGLVQRDPITLELVTDFYVENKDQLPDRIGIAMDEYNPTKILVSADYDYNDPDTNKQVNRFTIKVENHLNENATFNAYVSIDRGRTYKPVGELRIKAGEDEGKVNFRVKGSTFRFKLETTELRPNTINEFVMRLSQAGKEI